MSPIYWVGSPKFTAGHPAPLIAVVHHRMVGTLRSTDAAFTSTDGRAASTTFGVGYGCGRAGHPTTAHVHQYVRLGDQALIDRYGGSAAVGRKAAPGPLYGISRDVWSPAGEGRVLQGRRVRAGDRAGLRARRRVVPPQGRHRRSGQATGTRRRRRPGDRPHRPGARPSSPAVRPGPGPRPVGGDDGTSRRRGGGGGRPPITHPDRSRGSHLPRGVADAVGEDLGRRAMRSPKPCSSGSTSWG